MPARTAGRRVLLIVSVLALVVLFSLGAGGPAGAGSGADQRPRPTIVLVHGDWADASSWTGVIERLQDRGFTVVAPPKGETPGGLVARGGSCIDGRALNAVPIDGGVDLYLPWDANPPYPGFIRCFANGVEPEKAAVLAAAQRPAAAAQFVEPSGPPAWKTIPSWSLIGTLDNVIPRALQEEMSSRAGAHIARVRAGHLTPITRPGDVTKVIVSAVDATT
jgi:pimeloyl-ACP methyl ester carboxylesterase